MIVLLHVYARYREKAYIVAALLHGSFMYIYVTRVITLHHRRAWNVFFAPKSRTSLDSEAIVSASCLADRKFEFISRLVPSRDTLNDTLMILYEIFSFSFLPFSRPFSSSWERDNSSEEKLIVSVWLPGKFHITRGKDDIRIIKLLASYWLNLYVSLNGRGGIHSFLFLYGSGRKRGC